MYPKDHIGPSGLSIGDNGDRSKGFALQPHVISGIKMKHEMELTVHKHVVYVIGVSPGQMKSIKI
jgi:hypothetical protein